MDADVNEPRFDGFFNEEAEFVLQVGCVSLGFAAQRLQPSADSALLSSQAIAAPAREVSAVTVGIADSVVEGDLPVPEAVSEAPQASIATEERARVASPTAFAYNSVCICFIASEPL